MAGLHLTMPVMRIPVGNLQSGQQLNLLHLLPTSILETWLKENKTQIWLISLFYYCHEFCGFLFYLSTRVFPCMAMQFHSSVTFISASTHVFGLTE